MAVELKPDTRNISLCAGLVGLDLDREYDFNDGIWLSKTNAQIFGPFYVSHEPKIGDDSPGEKAGFGMADRFRAQLYVPQEFEGRGLFNDRLDTIWWIAALIRLAVSPKLRVPGVVGNPPGKEGPYWVKPQVVYPREIGRRRIVPTDDVYSFLSKPISFKEGSGLDWVVANWLKGWKLFQKEKALELAIRSFDESAATNEVPLYLLSLWSGLESLFSPTDEQELRFRISANISTYIASPGSERLEVFKKVRDLYDVRSSVVHGGRGRSGRRSSKTTPEAIEEALRDTYRLTREVLFKIFRDNQVPKPAKLTDSLFKGDKYL